jgi:hypothetical protein
MVVPQTVYCHESQIRNSELERWEEVVMDKFEVLSQYLLEMNE